MENNNELENRHGVPGIHRSSEVEGAAIVVGIPVVVRVISLIEVVAIVHIRNNSSVAIGIATVRVVAIVTVVGIVVVGVGVVKGIVGSFGKCVLASLEPIRYRELRSEKRFINTDCQVQVAVRTSEYINILVRVTKVTGGLDGIRASDGLERLEQFFQVDLLDLGHK